jgi:hypothetical protein
MIYCDGDDRRKYCLDGLGRRSGHNQSFRASPIPESNDTDWLDL